VCVCKEETAVREDIADSAQNRQGAGCVGQLTQAQADLTNCSRQLTQERADRNECERQRSESRDRLEAKAAVAVNCEHRLKQSKAALSNAMSQCPTASPSRPEAPRPGGSEADTTLIRCRDQMKTVDETVCCDNGTCNLHYVFFGSNGNRSRLPND